MDNRSRDDLIVGGYFFGSHDDAKQAAKEMKNAEYIESRIDSMSVSQMIVVYNKMLDEKVFKTPVGWEYLKYLKNRIEEAGADISELRPVPLYVTFTSSGEDNEYSHIAKMYIKPSKSKDQTAKEKYNLSVLINVILIILVIVMFIITLNSSSPNILNYKRAITDQYASWEEELNERENNLKEREKAIEDSDG